MSSSVEFGHSNGTTYLSESRGSHRITTHQYPNTAVPSNYHNEIIPTGSGLPDTKVTYSVISEQTADATERVVEAVHVPVTRVEAAPVVVTRTLRAAYERSEPVVVSTSTRPAEIRDHDCATSVTVVEHIPLDPKTYPRMSDREWNSSTRLSEISPASYTNSGYTASSRYVTSARPIVSSSASYPIAGTTYSSSTNVTSEL